MSEVVDYGIVKSSINDCYDKPLSCKVRPFIAEGWQPLGHAQAYVTSSGEVYMFQTLVKYKKPVATDDTHSVCEYCGISYQKNKKEQRFCSIKCKDRWWNRERNKDAYYIHPQCEDNFNGEV